MTMHFRGFTLDPFQEEAINALLKDESVVVSAATGTGKTLIADYIIDHAIKNNQKVFYTAPIKALSNQKYQDFCQAYGNNKVGLLTGDVVINTEAQVVVMTTEIYRNMLHDGSSTLQGLKYVVFDEIHYINDIERGTVWEESVIFSPDHVRFICLSATIPNYKQFASWIEHISNHKVATVSYMERAVPLSHQVYEFQTGLTTIDELQKHIKEDSNTPDYYQVMRRRNPRGPRNKHPVANHIDLVKELKSRDWLPAIFFVFSRKATLERAVELARNQDFALPEEKKYIIEYVRGKITPDIAHLPSVRQLRELLPKGIGVHNAGLLPKLKEIVEHLFNKGMLKVLYATETFAVGINMPAKTVCFSSLEKYDGVSFRYLTTKEYFQLAGRAGRRGIDKVGRSIVLVDRNSVDVAKVKATTEKDVDPIVSQFKLSYNMVLNLLRNYNDEKTIDKILRSNFGYFVKKQSAQQARITTSFSNYKRILEKLGYVKDNKLTQKGEFATHIYSDELVVSELVCEGYLNSLPLQDIVVLIAALAYEGRRGDEFNSKKANVERLLKHFSNNQIIARRIRRQQLKQLSFFVTTWVNGASFEELLKTCNLVEGDIIRLFRQIIDMLRQIRSGLITTRSNPQLLAVIDRCIAAIDRDVVAVLF